MRRPLDGYGKAIVTGLAIAALGLVMFIAAIISTPADQATTTGIGPAFLMVGGIGGMVIGGASALLAFALGALVRRHRQPDDP